MIDKPKLLLSAAQTQLAASELRLWLILVHVADETGTVDALAADLANQLNMESKRLHEAMAGLAAFNMLYRSPKRGRIAARIECNPDIWTWKNGRNVGKLLGGIAVISANCPSVQPEFRTNDCSTKTAGIPGQPGFEPAHYAAKMASSTEFGQESIIKKKNQRSKRISLVRTPSDPALDLAKKYHGRVKAMYPKLTVKMDEKTNIQGALVLDDLVRLDGHDWEHVNSVLRWVLTDAFWSRNLLSLASARTKGNNGQTKFVNAATKADLARALVEKAAGDDRPWKTVGRIVPDDDMTPVPNCLAWT